jgi:hypothetical protein
MKDARVKRYLPSVSVEFWRAILFIVGALCVALLAIGRVPPRDTHEKILTTLRAIDISHASLQRDVLQVKAGILRSFAPLDRSLFRLRTAVEQLRTLLPASGIDNIAALDDVSSTIRRSVEADAMLVERFQVESTMLRRSLTESNRLLTALRGTTNPAILRGMPEVHSVQSGIMEQVPQDSDEC